MGSINSANDLPAPHHTGFGLGTASSPLFFLIFLHVSYLWCRRIVKEKSKTCMPVIAFLHV